MKGIDRLYRLGERRHPLAPLGGFTQPGLGREPGTLGRQALLAPKAVIR